MSWAKAIGASVTTGATTHAYWKNEKERKAAAKNRPVYHIPKAEQEKLAMLHENALQGLPADIQAQYQESINRNQANASNNLTGLGAGLRGVGTIQQNANDAQLNFSGMNANAKQANKMALLNGLGEFADYQDQEFQVNSMNPYYEDIAWKKANNLAFQQGMADSGSTMGGSGFGGGGGKKQENSYQPTPQYKSTRDMGVTGTSPYDPNYKPYDPNYKSSYNPNGNFSMINNYYQPQSNEPYNFGG